jgi:hypothetical protein
MSHSEHLALRVYALVLLLSQGLFAQGLPVHPVRPVIESGVPVQLQFAQTATGQPYDSDSRLLLLPLNREAGPMVEETQVATELP